MNFVRKKLNSKVDLQEATRALTIEAISKGSIDNVTILIMSFHMPC